MSYTQQYEMKDSGVEWIGEIPKGWELERAKFHFRQSFEHGNDTPELLAATQKYGMYPQRLLEGVVQVMAGTDLQQFKTVHVNDFVISLRSFQGGFERSEYEGVCSPAYQVFHSDEQYDVNWLKWFFKNEMFIDAMNALTVGIREGRNIKYDDFANSLLPIPPLPEQTAIAAYLDDKCSAIDGIIAEAKATIEEYKAWKASVIFEAVTKGLDPNAEMKDSGVEWIGRIPKGWILCKIKDIARLFGRIGFRGYTSEDIVENGEGAITLSPSNIQDGKIQYKKCSFLSWKKYNESPEIQVNIGDIIFVKTGASYGKSAMVNFLPLQSTINPQLVVIKDIRCNSKFLIYSLQSQGVLFQCELYVVGGTIPTISQSKIGKMQIALPPPAEQAAIAAYLDEKCSAIDGIIAEKESLIAELESYKKSLIFETVTGKRRVC